jgi:hypothetical protein
MVFYGGDIVTCYGLESALYYVLFLDVEGNPETA